MTQHATGCQRVNKFCALPANKVNGPFLIMEQTTTGTAYHDMTELWLMPHLEDHGNKLFSQQDGAVSCFHCNVT